MDWVSQAREKSRTVVTSPISQRTFKIRKLSPSELTEARLSVILPKEELNNPVAIEDRAEKQIYEAVRYAIQNGVVDPKIFYGDENATPDGQVHISWISDDEMWLANEVTVWSGMKEAAKKAVQTATKNETGSEQSTLSVGPTEDSHTS